MRCKVSLKYWEHSDNERIITDVPYRRVLMGCVSGIHYSLKYLLIIHLIKSFAYSLKSIPLFIKNLIFLSLIIKPYIPHCLFPTLVPHPRPLKWFFTHWLTNSLNDNIHRWLLTVSLLSNNLTEHMCIFI